MQIKILNLKKDNESLKLNKKLDVNNYETWTNVDVIHWIITLDNGVYKQYENLLNKALNEENIDAACLGQIDGSDIKLWVITAFRHCKAIHCQIITLILVVMR